MTLIGFILFAYVLGSVPFGWLIARAHGVDLRTVGSGNIGATNVSRALGRTWAYVCFVLDVLKGLLPMLLAKQVGVVGTAPDAAALWMWLLIGCAAVCGHIFPVYLRFKGGKGVATSLGVVLGVWPYFTLCGLAVLAVWAVCVLVWRYVSLASIVAAASFPLIFAGLTAVLEAWRFGQLWPLFVVAVLMPILVVARHAENIKRLMEGSEHKILQKK
jgi:acyl phosphate:glycerol-3-phosphate acyltransferase